MPNVIRQEGPRPYWYVRYRIRVVEAMDQVKRKEVWHTLGYCDELTKREAERLRDELLRQVNTQVHTFQNQIPFKDFVEAYKEHHLVTLAPGGQKRNLSLLDNHIVPAFLGQRLCDITTLAIQAFLNRKAQEGLSWWTRKALQAVTGALFAKAETWNYWSGRNPIKGTTIGKKRAKRERRILSDEELGLLLAALPADTRLMVQTAVSTGMRISEILGLKWRCVDLERGRLSVTERYYRGDTSEPKTDRSIRVLPLGILTGAFAALRPKTCRPESYVFEREGAPLDDRGILGEIIRPAAEKLGMYFEGFGWHSFRRQNLTVLQEEGATAFEAMAQAGHSRTAMTSEYTIIDLNRREQAVRRLQTRLFGAPETEVS
ncbi:MAG TPA: tyrosine-type recombinase/integrase [Paludibaculum sp.]